MIVIHIYGFNGCCNIYSPSLSHLLYSIQSIAIGGNNLSGTSNASHIDNDDLAIIEHKPLIRSGNALPSSTLINPLLTKNPKFLNIQ